MNKKIFLTAAALLCSTALCFGQSDDDFSGFDDDSLFFVDDTIEELESQPAASSSQNEINHGTLFKDGSIKVGGKFESSVSTLTTLSSSDNNSFGTNLKNTKLTPVLSALLSVDARPTQVLRMYTKFGLEYPFASKGTTSINISDIENASVYKAYGLSSISGTTSVTDYLKVKELFTDFSIADRAFFRFGLHTVTWGTGYFFSPVSDLINTSSINPEDTDEAVNGALNLRTQITFPGTQNCLWLYVIPSTDFSSQTTAESYLKDTAFAAKADMVVDGWEFGAGGFLQYKNAPKAMVTASGSIIHGKVSVFGEAVYQYGAASEWEKSSQWKGKSNIFQATAGLSYYWKTPQITFAAQYYYDGNKKDALHQYVTQGHNIAGVISFARLFGTTDLTATVFGMVNFGKEDISDTLKAYLAQYGVASSYLSAGTFSAMLNYSPVDAFTVGAGPYITVSDWNSRPTVALKLSATLGGGKF